MSKVICLALLNFRLGSTFSALESLGFSYPLVVDLADLVGKTLFFTFKYANSLVVLDPVLELFTSLVKQSCSKDAQLTLVQRARILPNHLESRDQHSNDGRSSGM